MNNELHMTHEEARKRPRYGVQASMLVCNELARIATQYPETYQTIERAKGHILNQSAWIERVWRGLMRSVQEAER